MLIKETEEMTSSERMAARNSNSQFLQALSREAVDCIVETGTIDGWTYEKWKSGKVKCYGIIPYHFKGTTPNGAFYSERSYIYLPANLFVSTPTIAIGNVDIDGTVTIKLWLSSSTRLDISVNSAVRYDADNQCSISLYVVGRWK